MMVMVIPTSSDHLGRARVGEGTIARLTALSSRGTRGVLVTQVTVLVEEAVSVRVVVAGQVSLIRSEAAAPVTIHGVGITASGVTTGGDDSGRTARVRVDRALSDARVGRHF